MPFKPTANLPEPSDAYHYVDVIFRGLLLLRPDEGGNFCDIGVNRRAKDHYLTVAITGKPPSGNDFVIAYYAGPLNERQFSIRVEPLTKRGVFAYVPTPTPFDRSIDNVDADLQWAIDLEGSEFHKGKLEADPSGIYPGIEIYDGVFHTAMRTNKQDVRIVREDPAGKPTDMHSIGHVIGAAISLRAGENLEIDWMGSEGPKLLSLPRDEDPARTSYEIYIRNDPPGFYADSGHDELEQYYEVLRKQGGAIGDGDRFKLKASLGKLLTTDRIPCMPGFLGAFGR